MSGIVGLAQGDGSPVDRALLEELTASQSFRGPDGQGTWIGDGVGFGHTQLGADAGPQPCGLEDRLWITADVRLDGRDELLGRLRDRGRDRLNHASDAELILHAYDVWGDDCLRYLLGDFAFALWDHARRRLLCAVDHFRVKLFYYAVLGDRLVFSNTLDCVGRHPEVTNRLNETAVGDFLMFGYYEDADITIYEEVRRLPPAHFLTWEQGRVRVARYWSVPPEREPTSGRRDVLGEFDHLLSQAVGDRLRGGPVGVQLSGGLDSPMIAATALRLLGGGTGVSCPLQAYTVVFDRLIPDRERYYSGLVAQALGLPQHIEVRDDQLPFDWDGVKVPGPPEPIMEPYWGWNVRYSSHLAEQCRVLLTGTDGDTLLQSARRPHWSGLLRQGHVLQVLGEGAWFVATQRPLLAIRFRSMLGRLRKRPSPPPAPSLPEWLHPDFVQRAHLADRFAEKSQAVRVHTPRGQARSNLASPFWATVFDSEDPGWSGSPLESRHPLMDVRLVTFLLDLPPVPWCAQKELFRRWLRHRVPAEVHRRPKTPLAGNPVQVHSSGERWQREECSPTATVLTQFVALDRFSFYDYQEVLVFTIDDFFTHLRPIVLGNWLRTRYEKRSRHHSSSF